MHCSSLKELDISLCPVTNKGLASLCYDKNEDVKYCQELLRLSIVGCPVGIESVAFFVFTVSTLRDLIYENVIQVQL